MKIYPISIAKTFMAKHPRKGELTNFRELIENGQKIHTIRANFKRHESWVKRVLSGDAYMSLKQWEGIAYRSHPHEFKRFYTDVGIQKLEFTPLGLFIDDVEFDMPELLASNDGLTIEDFRSWFRGNTRPEPLAIIHFTTFKYTAT